MKLDINCRKLWDFIRIVKFSFDCCHFVVDIVVRLIDEKLDDCY